MTITAFVENCFSGPVLPASLLLLLVTAYWLLVIVTGMGLDMMDFDLDLDTDSIDSVLDFGVTGLRFFNFGRIPIMIWGSVFSLCFWTISMLLDHPSHRVAWPICGLMLLRNFVLTMGATKLLTHPLVGLFKSKRTLTREDLIGRWCIITTLEVTDQFGQAKIETDGAPLLLNVVNTDEELVKGDVAEVVDFDPHRNVYIVTKSNSEV
jgi:hypothetical protein